MECSICYNDYDHSQHFPHILPCGHTFCISCLKKLISPPSPFLFNMNIDFHCSTCKSDFSHLVPQGLQIFPKNYSLLEVIESKRITISLQTQKCSIHLKKSLDFYDFDCQRLICGHCLTIGDHRNHQCYPIDDPIILSKNNFALISSTLSQQLSNLTEVTMETNQEILLLNNHYEATKVHIDEIFRDLMLELERKRERIHEKLQSLYHSERNQLESQKLKISELRGICESLLKNCQNLEGNDQTRGRKRVKRMEFQQDGSEISERDFCDQDGWLLVGDLQTQYDIFQKEIQSLISLLSSYAIIDSSINSFFLRSPERVVFELDSVLLDVRVVSYQHLCYSLYLKSQCGDAISFQRLKLLAESASETPSNILDGLVAVGYYSMLIYDSSIPAIIPPNPFLGKQLSAQIYPLLESLPLKTSHENMIFGYLTASGLGNFEVKEGGENETKVDPGVERMNIHKGIEYYRLAHRQGNPEASCYLGGYYDPSADGIEPDLVESLRWYELSAKRNHPIGLANFGTCHLCGHGTDQNEVEAVRLFRLSAEQNYSGAQYLLGRCYTFGQGVERDELEGRRWFQLAAEQGFSLAIEELTNE